MTWYEDDKAAVEQRQQRLEMLFEELSLQVTQSNKGLIGDQHGKNSGKGSYDYQHKETNHNEDMEIFSMFPDFQSWTS